MSTVIVEQALAADPAKVGSLLLDVPEDQWFDRKSARIAARDLASHLVAFANAEGGTIVVGLSSGDVEGTDARVDRRNAHVQAAIDYTVPPVRVRTRLVPCVNCNEDEDLLLVLDIEPDDTVHATTKDEVYLRVGDESRKLNFTQRQELTYDKGQASYEARLVPEHATIPLDEVLVGHYAEAVQHPDPGRLFQARGLARDGRLTIAGCLLFAEEPQAWIPESYIRVLRYQGYARSQGEHQRLLTDERIEGPLPQQLLAARDLIVQEQPTRRALGPDGRFGLIPLIPEPVWLEAVVNAGVHRSYSMAGDHIRVEIFDDHIDVSSPGRLPGLVDFSDPLNIARFARNPRIARVCADLHFGQELGEGVRRMFQEMRDAGLHDPVYRQTSGSVVVSLSAEPMNQALDAQLTADARAVVFALRSVDRMSTGEIAQVLGTSNPTALKRLRRMEQEHLVRWVGKSPRDPRAYWTLPTP
ncbi:MAG TPA: ATP-binding protein [Baekduia sp.]|uniref:ATP-binding protein n=1 Tax=Baekduia sp. TaxID=2600305 RepID=UPI002CE993B1|nr:ATP-binding protein [Baekduia sp.]HMJ36131.1 ATP-binding protein [Baekduia sp.]